MVKSESKLPKKIKRLEMEKELFKLWTQENLYEFDPKIASDEKPLFTIDTPPPYSNSQFHMGSTIHYLTIDMVARMQRMKGFKVHFPMGLDRNGLPIEIAAERKFKVSMHVMEREKFLGLCKEILDDVGGQVLDLCYKIGMSCNSFEWEKVYKTDQDQYRALTQSTFIDMWKRGMVYEDDRPNNWDSKLKTTIADAEIEYREGSHTLYDIKFKVKETNEVFIISTTRLELIPAIRVVVYHPNDKRYQHLENKTASIPLWDIEVPIRPHPVADPEFGSGIMQICSFGDISDVRVIREFGYDPVYAIDVNGNLTDQTGKYEGMSINEGKKKIASDLKELGVIKSEKEVPHRYPVGERSGAPIEFIGMPEYYLKQEFLVDKLKQYSDSMAFYPEFMRQVWKDWLDRISKDWPISRRRFYGTEVPVWYCQECDHPQVPDPGPYYQPWKDDPPFNNCPKCSHNKFRGDERTFDTWMDSSVSALYISKYPNNKENKEFLKFCESRNYLSDFRPQGKDIVRTWLHYTMLRIHHLYNKPAFDTAWISGHVLLETGKKMSKSKGRGRKPELIVDQYGGDALRLFAAMEASHGSDVRFSEHRLKGGAKFLNKLYNIARFISFIDQPKNVKPHIESDLWILGELKRSSEKVMAGYNQFDPHPAAQALRNFTQETFSSHYVELVKNRAYNKDNLYSYEDSNSARATLYLIIDSILRLFAPIIPFITDYIYRKLFNASVHAQLFPNLNKYKPVDENTTKLLIAFNSAIWTAKQDKGLSLREKISSVELPSGLDPYKEDLMGMHNINSWGSKNQSTEIRLDPQTIIKISI